MLLPAVTDDDFILEVATGTTQATVVSGRGGVRGGVQSVAKCNLIARCSSVLHPGPFI